MSAPPLTAEMRRCRRALGRIDEAADRARALTTIPADTVERARWAGVARRPAVDIELWRLHVRHARRPDESTLSQLVERYRPHFRDVGWAIRVPRRVHDLASPTRNAIELLTHDLGRAPTPNEIADFIGVPASEVLDAMTAEEARTTSSLDAPDTTGRIADQSIGHVDRGFIGIENR